MKNLFALLLIGSMIFAFGCDKDHSGKRHIFYVTVTGERAIKPVIGQQTSATRSAIPDDKTNPQWLAKYVSEFYAWYRDQQTGQIVYPCRIFNFNPIDDPFRQRDTIQGKLYWFDIDVLIRGQLGQLFEFNDIIFVAMYVPSANRYINWWCREPNSGTWEELNPGIEEENYYENMVLDTVAYIPNRLLRETRDLAQEALDRGDTLACQRIFDEHLKYYPTTGAEYRELQARGEN